MSRKPLLLGITALAIAILALWGWRHASAKKEPIYRFATVERGNLEAAVSATGTLSAVTTVSVGTQVSGKIVETKVDFNDRVKKGELVARIDPTLLEQAVRDAQAGLERNEAEAEQAEREFKRNEQLFERKVLTEIEFNNAKYALAVARANVKSAQVTLDRARQNLSYTQIFAPIDGIVVERNVDVGQTVTASMSTPQLFLIANDLEQMQILASVDESDIGAIHEGQDVRFTVQAYPNEHFEGAVKQVRLQSKTTENVVNYTVVVRVENKGGKLLPGMTATLDFLTGEATDALLVPNSALRFRPTEEMREEIRKRFQAQRAANGGGSGDGESFPSFGANDGGGSAPAREGGGNRQFGGGQGGQFDNGQFGNGNRGGGAGAPLGAGAAARARGQLPPMLWYLDEKGQLAMTRVKAGLSDGQKTVIESPRVKEGMQVIIGVNQPQAATNSNPFGPGGPPGGNFNPGGNNFRRF
ncbi:MAG TPA: efflux RND transporter periplasmic adaptor subunit [Steroidobacteraceae bacterium]|jgi:HlyD family secretion protein